MSEFGEAVMAAVTDRWQSTAEISDAVPETASIHVESHRRKVYKHLAKLLRWGVVERDTVPASTGGRASFWRLRQ